MLEEAAPLLRPLAEGGIDQPLTDHCVALPEGGGQQRHVFEPDPSTVDEIVVLTGAEGAPGDGDLGELDREPALAVVEGDRDLRQPGRGAPLATGEDDILRPLGTQSAVALLAQHPADGVGDIRFATPVRPDDGRDARLEREHGARGEALEAVQLQPGQTRRCRRGGGEEARSQGGGVRMGSVRRAVHGWASPFGCDAPRAGAADGEPPIRLGQAQGSQGGRSPSGRAAGMDPGMEP